MSPEILATALILVSALLHAGANTLIKTSADALATRGSMNAMACALALPFVPLVPLPGAAAWGLLAASVAVHAVYPFVLVAAYRHADLNLAFPLARGAAPLAVAAIAYVVLDTAPGALALCGVVLLCAAIASLALSAGGARAPRRSVGYALATAVIVAVYTVIDAAGLKHAPSPWSYIVWLFVLDGATVALLVYLVRGRTWTAFLALHWRPTLAAALLGVLTYGLALVALWLGPVAEIAALRETSILFAALIGAWVLREPLGARRAAASFAAVLAIVLMRAGA